MARQKRRGRRGAVMVFILDRICNMLDTLRIMIATIHKDKLKPQKLCLLPFFFLSKTHKFIFLSKVILKHLFF